MVCSCPIGVVCFGDEGVPWGDPCFPEWGEVFEEFVGVVDGFTLLSDKSVVFFGAHGAIDVMSFVVTCVVCGLRG